MKKKWATLTAVSLAAMTVLTGCGGSQSESSKKSSDTLVIGMEPTFPPFEFTENDQYVGFDIDFAKAVADKLGMKAEVKSLGFDALIPALKSGQIDLIASGMDATPERAKQVSFTKPYFHDGYSVVVRKDNTTINGFQDLSGKNVCTQVGTKGVELGQQAGAVIKQVDANNQCWMELNSNNSDAVIINTSVAMYYLSHGGENDLKLAGEPQMAPDGIAMAVSKDKPEMLEKVNKAIDELKADGTYAQLYKKWFGTEPKE